MLPKLIAGLLLSLTLSCAHPVMDIQFPTGTDQYRTRFDLHHNFILVPITVEGRETLWFLDSAARRSFIDVEFARSLQLKVTDDVIGRDANGEHPLQQYTAVPLRIGPLHLEAPAFIGMDFKPLNAVIKRNAVGILGMDFLASVIVEVDYAGQSLVLSDPRRYQLQTQGGLQKVHVHRGYFVLDDVIVDGVAGRWAVDTGANGSTLNYRFIRSHPEFLQKKVGTQKAVAGASTAWEAQLKIENLQLGGRTFPAFIVAAQEQEKPGMAFQNDPIEGLVGNDLLKSFRVFMNWSAGQFILENPDPASSRTRVAPQL